MKIRVDKKRCIGAQSCLVFADKTFKLDKNGKAEVKDSQGNTEEEILQAAQSCPVDAIELYDDEGVKIYPK
jgi:ferredoxin